MRGPCMRSRVWCKGHNVVQYMYVCESLVASCAGKIVDPFLCGCHMRYLRSYADFMGEFFLSECLFRSCIHLNIPWVAQCSV